MPKITVLPHAELCPEGKIIETAPSGETICDVLLDNGIEIDHACEKSCACTTCHVIVRQGFDSLPEPSEIDLLEDRRTDAAAVVKRVLKKRSLTVDSGLLHEMQRELQNVPLAINKHPGGSDYKEELLALLQEDLAADGDAAHP